MTVDPSWDVALVANPALPERKQRRLLERAVDRDPVGLAEPVHQLSHRDEIVLPSALDRASRELLIRAQTAIDSALESIADQAIAGDTVESADIVTEPTLRSAGPPRPGSCRRRW